MRRSSSGCVWGVYGFVLLTAALAAAEEATRSVRGVVVATDGGAVARATVVLAQGERQLTATTNEAGEFQFEGLAPGPVALIATYGGAKATVTTDGVGEIRLRLPVAPEDVTIRELPPPAVTPRLHEGSAPRRWPYSDETILSNSWAVVWVLVLIDAEGRVAEARVLKSPPRLSLDDIAVAAAKKLRYEPARDFAGKAIPAQGVVILEWPPYWDNPRLRAPPVCTAGKGGGPLNLDDPTSAYRDCAAPKGLERLELSAPRRPPSSGKRWHAPLGHERGVR